MTAHYLLFSHKNLLEELQFTLLLFNNIFQVVVPSTTCLWVITFYLLIGTVLFAEWEGWDYLDSVYFCVTSLTKIGFGDLVPGLKDGEESDHESVKLVVNFVYILLGMAIVAMCYYLLKEEVNVKLNLLRNKIRDKLSLMKLART